MTTRTSDLHALGTTLLRLIVGVTFAAHGAQKLVSFGFAGTAGFLGSLGVPMANVMAPVLIATELVGGLLLVGVGTMTLALQGSGAFALDNLIGKRRLGASSEEIRRAA